MDPVTPSETYIQPRLTTLVGAALLTITTAVLALVVLVWGQPYLLAWLADPMLSPELRAVGSARLAAAILAFMVLMCAGVALWLGRAAWHIRTQGVFPPPAYPVLTKTLQVHGPAAQRKALQHAAACAITLLLGVAILGAVFYFLPLAATLRNLG